MFPWVGKERKAKDEKIANATNEGKLFQFSLGFQFVEFSVEGSGWCRGRVSGLIRGVR